MKEKILKIAALVFMGGSSFSLTACEMYRESYITPNRLEVHESEVNERLAAEEMDEAYLESLADAYIRTGQGALDVVVTYDPHSRHNTAMRATNKASQVAATLRSKGVDAVNASIMPVQRQGEKAEVLVSYNAYEALPPEDCRMMAGMEDRRVDVEMDYKLGCTVDTIMAKQVARPKDLAGRAGEDSTSEGRRAANMVEIYRGGTGNGPLEGESASGD